MTVASNYDNEVHVRYVDTGASNEDIPGTDDDTISVVPGELGTIVKRIVTNERGRAEIIYPGEVDSILEIVSISGNEESYFTQQNINLIVETLENDDTTATSNEGWNIQYYTYRVGNQINLFGSGNARYSEEEGSHWKIDSFAPLELG